MKREIKFRAYVNIKCHELVLNKEIGTGSHWVSKLCMCEVLQLNISKNSMRVRWSKGNTADVDIDNLMQFTGLKDKNRVDIYEGDILENAKSSKGNFFVKFNVGSYDAVYKGNFTLCLHPVLFDFDGAIIIGNIHQNPNLLTL